VMKVMELLP